MEAIGGEVVVAFVDAARWETWLADHHGRKTGVSMYNFTNRMSLACGMIPNDEYHSLAR